MKLAITKLKTSIVFFLFVVSIGLHAADNAVIKNKVIYKTAQGKPLHVFVYDSPKNCKDQKRPAMAFFHGGGWAYGNPNEFEVACNRYAKKNLVCFTFQYRLSMTNNGNVPHPDISLIECVKDTRSAIRWIRKNADVYNINSHQIIACGQSAGGQLALGTALFSSINDESDDLTISSIPDAFVLYSSNVNTIEAWADMLMGDRHEQIWSVSPFHNLKTGMPPAIAFHGTADRMVPYWVVTRFRDKTIELGNQFELITFNGRRHYLGDVDQNKKSYYDDEILNITDDFLMRMGFIK